MSPHRYALRHIDVLSKLLELPATRLDLALAHACDLVALSLRADKVDAFVHDPERNSLSAVGTSSQPLSDLQRQNGLDVLPIANGGRAVYVFQTGKTFVDGRVDEDQEELRGVRKVLNVRSTLGVPLDVGGERRGVLMAASLQNDFFTSDDALLGEAVARWIGAIAHRAELVEEIARVATEQGRRTAADELVTVLAHDLRNYLAPISARLQLICQRAIGKRPTDERDAKAALAAVDRLRSLVTDLLDVARIDQGLFELELQPLDLVALAHEVAAALTHADHEIIIEGTGEVVVNGDPARLRQCLENLVTNAIKHSPDKLPVTIRVSSMERGDDQFGKVDVIDSGPGISPDIQQRLFERFAKAKGSQGIGLGLYLAHRITEAHRGQLTATSEPGKGATFTLLVPAETHLDFNS